MITLLILPYYTNKRDGAEFMKKCLSLIMALILFFSINSMVIAEAKAKAEELPVEQFEVTVEDVKYDLNIYTQDNLRTVIVDDENTIETVVYDMENKKIYVNGEEISSGVVTPIEELQRMDDSIQTFAADQGAGVGVTWMYEYTNRGYINFGSLATAAIVGVLAAVFTKNAIVGGLAAVATAITGAISSDRKTVYYTEVRYWKPDPNWPKLYKDYKSVLTFYKYAEYTGKITSKTIYH